MELAAVLQISASFNYYESGRLRGGKLKKNV